MSDVYSKPNLMDEYEVSRQKVIDKLADESLESRFKAVKAKLNIEFPKEPITPSNVSEQTPVTNPAEILTEEVQAPTDYLGNVIDAVSFVTSPLTALGAAGLAPVANPANTGSILGDIKENFKTSGNAFIDKLFPVYGADSPPLAEGAAENLGLPEWAAPYLEIVTDPTIIAGLPAIKAAQRGLRLTQTQKMEGIKGIGLDSSAPPSGIMENAIGEFLGTKLSNTIPSKQQQKLAKLAKNMDLGDANSGKSLVKYLNSSKEFRQHALELDDKDVANQVSEIKQIMGDPREASLKFSKTDTEDSVEILKKSLGSSDQSGRLTEINLANLSTSSSIVKIMDNMLFKYSEDFAHLLKKQTHSSTVEAAQHTQLIDLFGKKVTEFTPSESYAIRQATLASAYNLKNKLIIAGQPTASPLHKAEVAKALAFHRMVQAKATGVSSHSGRLLNAQKIKVKTDRDLIRSANEIATNFGEGSREINRLISTLNSNPFLDLSVMNKLSAGSALAKGDDMFFELFVNSILSGPVTHAVNIGSNGLNAVWQVPQTVARGMSAYATGKLYDGNTQMLEANAKLVGILGGFSDSMRLMGRSSNISYQAGSKNLKAAVAEIMQTGGKTKRVSKEAVVALKAKQWADLGIHDEMRKTHELNTQRYAPNITAEALGARGVLGAAINGLGSVIRIPGNLLLAEDKGFKLINYRMAINASAVRRSRTLGKNLDSSARRNMYNALVKNPEDSTLEAALNFADYNTFTSQLGNGWQRDLGKVIHRPGIRYVAPFFRTPTNIVNMGVRNSVLGHVFKDIKPALTKRTAEGDAARARIAMGTLIPATLISMVDSDRMTGRIDESTAKGRFKTATGMAPYSFRVGDQWVSYEAVEPLRGILGLLVNYREAIDAMDVVDETGMPTDQFDQLLTTVIAPFISTATDNYVLPQMGLLTDVMTSINSGNTEYAAKSVKRLIASALVPSALRQVNKELDDTVRRAETLQEMLMQGIPGFSKELPERYTVWGDAQTHPQYLNKDIISRVYTESLGQDKYDKTITELDVNIPLERKTITLNKLRLELTPQQTARHSFIMGKGADGTNPLKNSFIEMIDSPGFLMLSKQKQKASLNKRFTQARKMADKILLAEDPTLHKQYLVRKEAFLRTMDTGN